MTPSHGSSISVANAPKTLIDPAAALGAALATWLAASLAGGVVALGDAPPQATTIVADTMASTRERRR